MPYIESFGERRPKEYMLADQRFVSDRSDVLTFVTEPLDGDMTLAGPVDVELEVILSTTDADFVVSATGSRVPKPLRRAFRPACRSA